MGDVLGKKQPGVQTVLKTFQTTSSFLHLAYHASYLLGPLHQTPSNWFVQKAEQVNQNPNKKRLFGRLKTKYQTQDEIA